MSGAETTHYRRPGVRGHCRKCDRTVTKALPLTIISNASGKFVACRECGRGVWCRKAELAPANQTITDGGTAVSPEAENRARQLGHCVSVLNALKADRAEARDAIQSVIDALREYGASLNVESIPTDTAGDDPDPNDYRNAAVFLESVQRHLEDGGDRERCTAVAAICGQEAEAGDGA